MTGQRHRHGNDHSDAGAGESHRGSGCGRGRLTSRPAYSPADGWVSDIPSLWVHRGVQPSVGSLQRARDAAPLIVVLAMACVSAPRVVLGADSGGGSGSDGPIGFFDPVLVASIGAVAFVAALLGVTLLRRRRHWRQGIPVSDAVPREARGDLLRSIDDPVPYVPRLREFELGDEAKLPRWLRPSVQAERFTPLQADARSSMDPASREDAALKEGSVDLDALFASRRPSKARSKTSTRATTRRRRTATS